VGGPAADRAGREGRGAPAAPGGLRRYRDGGGQLTDGYGEVFREHWRTAVAVAARLSGDLDLAEDAAQEACALALEKWPAEGVPANPGAWLAGVARHKALDQLRREARRAGKEAVAVTDPLAGAPGAPGVPWPDSLPPVSGIAANGDSWAAADELGLIFMCCHPALDPAARIALTLRSVCGQDTKAIAAAFMVPEPTVAQRIVRAKRKIRQAGIRMRVPGREELPGRLAAVLRVVYLVYTQGHLATSGPELVRGELCDEAIRLARTLAALLPEEPEAAGLHAFLLLTDARRDARVDGAGNLVLLADQDRSRWNQERIAEGELLLEGALRAGRPGPYQLHAAIAACHSCAASAQETDWREIAALYGELIRYEPTAAVEANRAVAVAMSEGPSAGLVILDALGGNPRLTGWPQFHIARGELLTRVGRPADAALAYRAALALGMSAPERAFIESRLAAL
jgi:RNA polymerase sigma-70 factor, ECF subfamily